MINSTNYNFMCILNTIVSDIKRIISTLKVATSSPKRPPDGAISPVNTANEIFKYTEICLYKTS